MADCVEKAADNGADGGTVALTKTGSGTLTIVSTNTFEGSTTVSAGTLVLSTPGSSISLLVTNGASCQLTNTSSAVSTNATIIITNGVLKLSSGVNQKVKYLSLNGTWEGAGTWGSSSSPAQNVNNACFSGAGEVTVLGGGAPHVLKAPVYPILFISFTSPNLTLSWAADYIGWRHCRHRMAV